jgi:hypothetical protein
MLVDFILNLIYWIIAGFLQLLPTTTFSDDIAAAIAMASSYLSSVSNFLPVTTLFVILGSFLTIETVILGIKILNWAIRKIPTIS